jgi:poly(hydroxyalkanoate) depolymerase family esterase
MRGLAATTASLMRLRKQWEGLAANTATHHAPAPETRLSPVRDFGSNPGALEMLTYVPARLAPAPALVVVLHGCTQTAASYEHGAGWSELADRHGFVLLYPQQSSANNQKTCFNWFLPGDIARDRGEALSIRQMVERAVRDHGIDRSRIFVTGLSAGGAMTAVMLATYPETFAAGAVIAGLPYGAALNVQSALESMFQGRTMPARQLGDLVRAASPHRGPWPRLSVWHGSADHVVKPGNAEELLKQWRDLHGLADMPDAEESVDGQARRTWRDEAGRHVIESYSIAGMGHGTPLATGGGDAQAGQAGPYMLEAGISSSHHIARFWGLTDVLTASTDVAIVSSDGTVRLDPKPAAKPKARPARARAGATADQPKAAFETGPLDVGAVIARAFRAAGLTRP